MTKIEPALMAVLGRRRNGAPEPTPGEDAAPTGDAPAGSVPLVRRTDVVQIAVKFTGDVEDLKAMGFEPLSLRSHPTQGWSIAAGPISVDRLEALDAIDHIVLIEGSRPMPPELDQSTIETGVKLLHQTSPPFKGKGVVVGIIDSGIEWRHGSFRNEDGSSRILAIWDQNLSKNEEGAQPGEEPPNQFDWGVEYLKAEHIDPALDGDLDIRTKDHDSDGHGTHVAGIAAGNGMQPGDCEDPGTYAGVAPDADLIVVSTEIAAVQIGESHNLIHAIDYICNHPAANGRPIAINISLGDNLGAHDGTSLVESWIDLLVEASSSIAIIKSAGNEGESRHHARATVPPGESRDVNFTVKAGGRRAVRHIQIWYEFAASVRITVEQGEPDESGQTNHVTVEPGNVLVWIVNPSRPELHQTAVRIDSRNEITGLDNHIHVEFVPAGAPARLPSGAWNLKLTNIGGVEANIDLWLEREPPTRSPTFGSATRQGTITIPGTAKHVITVGAYAPRSFLYDDSTGELYERSSRGPTRDGRAKPDLVAPGVAITSARARSPNCCCDCCRTFYREGTGTSMAAPHVTGVVALMLQKNPTLTAIQVKDHLTRTARKPDGVEAVDLPNNWGAGMLDAPAALDDVPAIDSPDPGNDPNGPGGGLSPRPRTGDLLDAAGRPLSGRVGPMGAAPLLAAIHRQLLAQSWGERWAALVSQHFSEVRGLVNSKRRVALRWHRMQGPALIANLAHLAAGAPAGVVLPRLDLGTFPQRLEAFFAELEKYGSPALIDAVQSLRLEIEGIDVPRAVRTLVATTAVV